MSANPNVGYATLSIIPSAKGFGAALNDTVGPDVRKSGEKHGREYGTVYAKSAMGPLRVLGGAAAGIFAIDKAAGFLKDAVNQASDLNEAGTALAQVFGKATPNVLAFAQGGAKAFGQSNLALQNAAISFGVYGKAAGLAGKANADFSTQMVGLSTDLASFYNTSPQEAADALAAGLRGESEPLRRFGVLLNDTQLRQEALSLGIIKTTKTALTPQQRVLAAHALILQQTKVAQGDFARTSGGLANQQRILSAQFDNMKGKIGAGLLPVILGAVKGVNGLFGSFSSVGSAMSDLWSGFTVGTDALGSAQTQWAVFGAVLYEKVAPVIAAVRDYLGQLQTVITTQVVPALESLWAYFQAKILPVIVQIVDIFATKVLPILFEVASFIIGKVVPAVLSIYESVAAKLAPILTALVQSIQANILPALAGVYTKFQTWLPTIEAVVMVVLKVTGFLLKLAATILGEVLPPLVKLTGFLLGTVIDVLGTLIGWIVKVVAAILDIPSAMKSAYHFVADKFGDIVTFVTGMPGKIAHAASGMWDGIKDAFRDAINWIIRGWNGLQFHMPSIDTHIPGVGKVGGFDIGMPDIPLLANGGIATRATLAMIGEGSQPEAVIPLDKLSAIMRGRYSDSPADAGSRSATSRGAREYVAPILLDGRQIAEAVFAVGGSDLYYGRKVDG